MRLLLDTNVFLRYFLAPRKLTVASRHALESGEHEICVSAVTPWEIAIKALAGKLVIPMELGGYVSQRMERAGFIELPVTFEHAIAVRELPAIHRDPFDRLLVAQAISDGRTLVTSDRHIARYPVRTLPA